MKNYSFIRVIGAFALIVSMLSCYNGFAQEEEATEPVKERPARPAFVSGLLFDAATTTIQSAKTL